MTDTTVSAWFGRYWGAQLAAAARIPDEQRRIEAIDRLTLSMACMGLVRAPDSENLFPPSATAAELKALRDNPFIGINRAFGGEL